ncbi:MAG: hypothetical protein ABFR05_00720 [Bacteroidota bacterium]
MKSKVFFTKATQWEHWPAFMFYIPLIPYLMLNAIKAKYPVHYLATNPGILYSGNGTESKYKSLMLVPEKYRPKSILIQKNEKLELIINQLESKNINYPIIAKPDIGFRGYLVKKIESETHLRSYFNKMDIPIILQEFIDHPNEMGIFYHRMPDSEQGKITSITIKKYQTLTGDGTSTLSELILNHKEAFLYHDVFKNIHKERINNILKEGEKITVSEIGNHCKGTQFINGNNLITKDMGNLFDNLSNQIEGWFYGRLDIKFANLESFLQGENFTILEINGIISEPTHIYDTTDNGSSYWNALKAIKKHWGIMDKIAIKNHREFGVEYPKVFPYLKNILWLSSYTKKLKKLNKV